MLVSNRDLSRDIQSLGLAILVARLGLSMRVELIPLLMVLASLLLGIVLETSHRLGFVDCLDPDNHFVFASIWCLSLAE